MIIDEGFVKLPFKTLEGYQIFAKEEDRLLYDPQRDMIIAAYTLKNKNKKI